VFRYARRVQFAETDLAGMVHFANFFRYMEEAEHALWRAAGMSISPSLADGSPAGSGPAAAANQLHWPRVAAAFDFKRPLRFEDEFEVQVGIGTVTSRTIQYNHTIRLSEITVGVGTVTAVCVRREADGGMKAVEIPPEILGRLRGAGT
jgi:acyl-CoA thioester hydrolase